MKHTQILLTLAIGAALLAPAAQAQEGWSFKNVSINHLDWSSRTETETGKGPFAQKKDFTFLEVEGGMGGQWGEVYAFADLENPGNESNNVGDPANNRRVAMKVVGQFNLTQVGGMPVRLYTHLYNFVDNGFNNQNQVLGLSTAYSSGSFWAKPFIGFNHETQTGAGTEVNGGMLGWVLGYSFKAMDQSFMVTSWHETEFNRRDAFLAQAQEGAVVTANKTGQNGAVSLWWNATPSITAGLSYRYAQNKLGSATTQDALIYTAKFNF